MSRDLKDGTENAEEFDLKLWAAFANISEAGIKKIEGGQIADLETLLLVEREDLDLLRLSVGDSLRFRAGITKLHAVHDKPPSLSDLPTFPVKKEVVPAPVSTLTPEEKLYTQKDVEKLLAGRGAVAAAQDPPQRVAQQDVQQSVQQVAQRGVVAALGSSLTALLSKSTESSVAEVRELMKDLLNFDDAPTNARGEKVLLPIHFLSCIRGTQDTDEIIHSGKGLNLVLQSTNKRVSPERLTTGQWVGANARILSKLISSGKLTNSQVTDYLDYTRRIGDLLQLFNPSSVFMLDHNHRLDVHDEDDRRWNCIDATLQSAHLRRKDEAHHAQTGSSARAGPSNTRRNSTRHINMPCWNFNSSGGCPFTKDKCRYDHVESHKKNPRSGGQMERAPRFQKGGSGGSGNA